MNFSQQDIHLLFESACLFRPLYFFTLKIWTTLLGYGEFSARLLSVLFSVASIWPLYLISKKVTTRQTSVLIILLFSLSPYRVIISQQIRNYSLFVLLSLLSVYFFLQIVTLSQKRPYLSYFASTLLFIYTHPYALFLILTQNIYFLWGHRNTLRKISLWLKGQCVLLISALPLLALYRMDSVKSQFGSIPVFQQTLKPLLHTFEAYSYGGPFIGQGGTSSIITAPLLTVERLMMSLFFICAGFSLLKVKKTQTSPDRELMFIIVWAFFPLLLVYSLSFAMPALYQTRYVLFSFPPFIILYCTGLARFSHTVVKRIVLFLLCVTMLLFLPGYFHGKTQDQFYSWREAAHHVKKNIEENDGLLFMPSEQMVPFWYYYKNDEKKPLQFIGSGRLGQAYFQNKQWQQVFSDKSHQILTIPFHTIYYQTEQEWQLMYQDFLTHHLSGKQEIIWLILSPGWIGWQKAQTLIDVLKKEYQLISHSTFDFDGIEVLSFKKNTIPRNIGANKSALSNQLNKE